LSKKALLLFLQLQQLHFLQLQELAKKHLEAEFPVQVVAGYVASAHDYYVEQKYRYAGRMSSFIPWETRIELIEKAVKGHSWIRADHWDGNEESFYEYYDTQKSLVKFMEAWCQQKGFERVHFFGLHFGSLPLKEYIAFV
jgi:hypothetical protein